MRHTLHSLLILALLSTGFVWAADAHVDLLPEHSINSAGCLYDTPVDDSDHHQSHGCHMSSHLVAMTSDNDALRAEGHEVHFPGLLQSLNSRPATPPVKPPRA